MMNRLLWLKRTENIMDSSVSNCDGASTVSTKNDQGITGIRTQICYNTKGIKKWMLILVISIMFFPQGTNGYSDERCPTDTCPTHGEYCHNYLTFRTRCNTTHPLTCGDDQTGTVQMFCHEPHECQTLGTYNSVLHVDGKNSIECKECPAGTFLSYLSKSPNDMNCVNHEHPHEGEKSEYILAKNGTSTTQAVYSCNFKEGYISVYKHMYCQPYHLCTCAHVGEIVHTSCEIHEDILPDWSCSVKCEPGSKRDPLNNYSCSSIGKQTVKPTGTSKSVTMSQTNETTTATTTSSVDPGQQQTVKPTGTSKSVTMSQTNETTTATSTVDPEAAPTDKTSDDNYTTIIIVIVVPVVVLLAAILILRKKMFCNFCPISDMHAQEVHFKNPKYVSVHQADNVHIGDEVSP